MTSLLLLILLPFLLISLLDCAPTQRSPGFQKILVPECRNHGYISHNKCNCIKGTFGPTCNYYLATMCEDGVCPYSWMYCDWVNEDCHNTPLRCLDKRGWCRAFEQPPYTIITDEEELYYTP